MEAKNLIETYGTIETLVKNAVDAVVHSDTTEHMIRKNIIDPLTNKFAKGLSIRGMHNCNYALMTLFAIDPDEVKKMMVDTDGLNSETQTQHILEDIKNGTTEHYFIHYMPNRGRRRVHYLNLDGHRVKVVWIGTYKGYNFNIEIIPTMDKNHKYLDELKKKIDHTRDLFERFQTSKDTVKVYTSERGRIRINYTSVPKSLNLDSVQQALDSVIRSAERAIEVRDTYGLSKTTGVLLYGPHGTGKSTIAKYLARELKRPLVVAAGDDLQSSLRIIENQCDGRAILLIEDIDFKFTNRSTKGDSFTALENLGNADGPWGAAASVSNATDTLFQIMDGSLANANLVVVATTNYVDRLDPALIRDGRFDHKIKVDGLSYEQAVNICQTFGVDANEIGLDQWPIPISPASLQSFILDFKVNGTKHAIPRDAVSAAMDAGESYEDLAMIEDRMRRLLVKEQGGSIMPKSEVLRQLDELGMHDMSEMDIDIIHHGLNRGATYTKDPEKNVIELNITNTDTKFKETANRAIPKLLTVEIIMEVEEEEKDEKPAAPKKPRKKRNVPKDLPETPIKVDCTESEDE